MNSNNNIPMINHPYKTAKGLKRYVRDILKQVQQEETLKKIIDISSKINNSAECKKEQSVANQL